MENILKHYLKAALESSINQNGLTFDSEYSYDDVSQELKDTSLRDLTNFKQLAGLLLDGIEDDQIGRDFWFTRNGHENGFGYKEYYEYDNLKHDFKRNFETNDLIVDVEKGKMLAAICKQFYPVYLQVGNDEQIYGE